MSGKVAKKNKKDGVTATTFADIEKVAKKIKKAILPKYYMPSLEDLAGNVDEKLRILKQMKKDVPKAIEFLINAKRRIAACEDNTEKKIVFSEMEHHITETQGYLEKIFALEDAALKSAASVLYLRTMFSQNFVDYREAVEALNNLIQSGLLLDDMNGQVLIAYKHYQFSPEIGIDAEELAGIEILVDKFSKLLMRLEGKHRQEKAEMLKTMSTITLDEALDNKDGELLLPIPPEYKGKKPNGEDDWRGGGHLLLEFKGGYIYPLDSSGSIENGIAEMVENKVRLKRKAIGWRVPPGHKDQFDKAAGDIQLDYGFAERETANAWLRKLQALWHMIQRGLKTAEENKKKAEIKGSMAAEANISSLEFFNLTGEEIIQGTALLQYKGVIRQGYLFEPFMLVGKEQTEDKKVFKIVKVPPHLEKQFGHLIGQKFPLTEDFNDCPRILGRVMKTIRGQELMTSVIS